MSQKQECEHDWAQHLGFFDYNDACCAIFCCLECDNLWNEDLTDYDFGKPIELAMSARKQSEERK